MMKIEKFVTPSMSIEELPFTREQLTEAYNKANGIEGKNPPLTTERIFRAMCYMYDQGSKASRFFGDWV